MAETNNLRGSDRRTGQGLIYKAAELSAQEMTPAELQEINRYTLAPLTEEEVFTFKAVLCDNELDRQYEQFTVTALQQLQKLFLGKTVIKDHTYLADNQVARIYRTELEQESGKRTKSGDPYTKLVAHCYMVRTPGNADLIQEIKGGIKQEGSVGFAASGCVCNICGTDNVKTYCPHWPGRSYQVDGERRVCHFTLTGAKDAYEFSLVAVPAQRAAGVCKSYTGETVYAPPEQEREEDMERAKSLTIQARLAALSAKINQSND